MSVLALQLPPRERLTARVAGAADATGTALKLPHEWAFAFSTDGSTLAQQGTAALPLLPRADHVVLVLAEADVSWHRVDIPRAPAARLRAALQGVMEEALLEDDEQLHFALAQGSQAGQPGWVAVTHRPRLAARPGTACPRTPTCASTAFATTATGSASGAWSKPWTSTRYAPPRRSTWPCSTIFRKSHN